MRTGLDALQEERSDLIKQKQRIDLELDRIKLELNHARRVNWETGSRVNQSRWRELQDLNTSTIRALDAINALLSGVNKEIKEINVRISARFDQAFIDEARRTLPPDLFKRISDAARSRSQ